jgi:hypothetical protein
MTSCTTNTGPITTTVGNNGGTASRRVFAAGGDTRPNTEDDYMDYPTTTIGPIFSDIQGQTARPVLVVGTGDYQYSEATNDNAANQQVQIFMQSRATFSGPFFPAMGNHECGVSGPYCSSDNANCGPGNPGGTTANYNAFMTYMMQPIGQQNPWYSINVSAPDNSWTAKFVITAANSWSTAQQTWLEATLAVATTYTFVVRHEPSDAEPPGDGCTCSGAACIAPGVAGVDALLAQYPYTLLIVGHTHDFGYWGGQSVTFGNGGAPLSNTTDYDFGFGLFAQRCDGAIVVDEIDYKTGMPDSRLHFVVTPTGQQTQ